MVSEQFVWCRNCDKIHHVTLPDNRLGREIIETATDDWPHSAINIAAITLSRS